MNMCKRTHKYVVNDCHTSANRDINIYPSVSRSCIFSLLYISLSLSASQIISISAPLFPLCLCYLCGCLVCVCLIVFVVLVTRKHIRKTQKHGIISFDTLSRRDIYISLFLSLSLSLSLSFSMRVCVCVLVCV